MIQSASLFGSLFTGLIIAATNACAVMAFIKFRENGPVPRIRVNYYAAVAVSIAAANFAFGFLSLLYSGDVGTPVSVALIQGNIASGDKWQGSIYDTFDIYSSLTQEAVEKHMPSIIIWPETVVNVKLKNYSDLYNSMRQLAMESEAIIMVGTFDAKTDETTGESKNYNAIFTFYPDGSVGEEPYYKRHPVPFGEYLPWEDFFRRFFPLVANIRIYDSEITPGSGAALTETPFGKIGGLVCFDSIYETLTLDSVREGASLIALVTNDSWYRDSAAASQHNNHAVLRAVESGRYVARAANTGISSIISPHGKTIDSLGALETGYVTGNVYFYGERTLYSYIGNLIVWICFGFYLTCATIKIYGLISSGYFKNRFKAKPRAKKRAKRL